MSYNILILEDNLDKFDRIKEALFPFLDSIKINHCEDIEKGAIAIKNNPQFDLLILDISLPLKKGGKISKYSGVNFLNSICKRKDIERPKEIIGLTQHKDVFQKANPTFEENLIYLVRYKINDKTWEGKLSNRLSFLLNEKQNEEVSSKDWVNHIIVLCKKNKIIALVILIGIIIISFGDLIEKSKTILNFIKIDHKEIKTDTLLKTKSLKIIKSDTIK